MQHPFRLLYSAPGGTGAPSPALRQLALAGSEGHSARSLHGSSHSTHSRQSSRLPIGSGMIMLKVAGFFMPHPSHRTRVCGGAEWVRGCAHSGETPPPVFSGLVLLLFLSRLAASKTWELRLRGGGGGVGAGGDGGGGAGGGSDLAILRVSLVGVGALLCSAGPWFCGAPKGAASMPRCICWLPRIGCAAASVAPPSSDPIDSSSIAPTAMRSTIPSSAAAASARRRQHSLRRSASRSSGGGGHGLPGASVSRARRPGETRGHLCAPSSLRVSRHCLVRTFAASAHSAATCPLATPSSSF